MKHLSKVVWQEGMHLAPHHFQTQSRFVEDSIQFAASALWFRPYGLLSCELDSEALENGTARVIAATGVLPDGLPFSIPDSDEAPPARAISDVFSPTRDHHCLLLTLPERRPDGVNFDSGGDAFAKAARYAAQPQIVRDETNGREERSVEVGRKNFRLLLDHESTDGSVAMPIARIRRDGSGKLVYDGTYIPPVLDISASEHALEMLRNLVGALEEKSRIMMGEHPDPQAALADRYRRDLASFWFLHTIHSSLGVLRHLLLARRGHPEDLYRELCRLAGAFCSFSMSSHPRDLPLYDHLRLGECFQALEEHIRAHLDLIVPTGVVAIPLEPAGDSYWTADIKDPRLLGPSRWLLGIQSQAGEAPVISLTPQLVKVCSEKFIRELVKRAVPGLTLTHLPAPPPKVPTRVEASYFGITRSGPCWDHIVMTKRVGVYVPANLPNPEMEIIVLLEN